MLSDREREAASLGMQILDQALISLGQHPLGENPDFRITDEFVRGDTPNAVLERPGVAPFRFLFGAEIEVWVGPFAEVVIVPIAETPENAQDAIKNLLRSSVTCRRRKLWLEIALQRPGEEPWSRLKVLGAGSESELEPIYAPYAA